MDITNWLPGEYTETICFDIDSDFANGEYELQIAIGGGDMPSVAFANEMETNGEFYSLAKIKIEK